MVEGRIFSLKLTISGLTSWRSSPEELRPVRRDNLRRLRRIATNCSNSPGYWASARAECRQTRRKLSLSFERGLVYVVTMNPLLSRITVEPGKCGGRPCIRGYRLRVKDVLELLAHGASWDEILADYPFLEADDIRACLEFAAAQNDHVILRAS